VAFSVSVYLTISATRLAVTALSLVHLTFAIAVAWLEQPIEVLTAAAWILIPLEELLVVR